MSLHGDPIQGSVIGAGGVSENAAELVERAVSAYTETVLQTPQGVGNCPLKPQIAVTPLFRDFGRRRLADEDRASLTITITNPGDATLHFTGPIEARGDVEDFAVSGGPGTGTTLAPQSGGPEAKLEFTVTCRVKAAGSRTLELRISSDASNVEGPVVVSIVAEGTLPALQVDLQEKNFGSLAWDKTPLTQTFVLTNPGSAEVQIGKVSLSGHGDFSVVSDEASGKSLKPLSEQKDANCKIVVQYTPKLHGEAAGELEVSSPDVPALKAKVQGKGLFPLIRVAPAPLDFQNFRVGDKAVPGKVTIFNIGDAALTLSSVSVGDDAESCYLLDTDRPWSTRIGVEESTDAWLFFTPKQPGRAEAKLHIVSDALNAKEVSVSLEAAVFSIENLRVPEYMAAGEDTVDVLYRINDPAGIVNELKLEILSKDGGETVIYTKALDPKDYQDGERTYEKWQAEVTNAPEYPDGFATIVHSPYLLRLTASAPNLVSTPGGSSTAILEKEFKVEAEKLVIEPGPRTLLKNAKYQDVYDGSLPARGDTNPKKLYLTSDIYYQEYREDHANNPTDFEEYKKMWGDGPLIPIYATLYIRSATGQAKPAGLAWGKAEVLWDYEDVATGTAGLSSKQAAFVGTAQERSKANTKPSGDNCPGDLPDSSSNDLGGKRTLAGDARRVLPASADYPSAEVNSFPFTCTAAPNPRPWAIYSTTNKSEGPVKGKTGILFRPSRMAGDRYRVKAYLDIQKQHYRAKDVTEPVSDETGVFEIWRRLHVQKVFSKDAGAITSFVHAEVAQLYRPAYIDFVDTTGGAEAMPASYSNAFKQAIEGRSETLMKEHAVQEKDDQQTAAGKAAVAIRSYTDFKSSYVSAKVSSGAATSEQAAQSALHIALSAATEIEAESSYHKTAYSFAKAVTEKACDTLLGEAAGDGVVVFLFENITTQPAVYQGTNGMAIGPGSRGELPNTEARRSRTGYMQFKPAAKYEAPESLTQTVAHEIGHQLFLPHTRMEDKSSDPAAHDAAHFGCLMSYSFDVTREFCGYCLLRLRGWNHTRLTNQISRNQLQPAIRVTVSGAFTGSGSARPFTITSTGRAPLTIQEIRLASGDVSDFRIADGPALPKEMPESSSATFRVIFEPKGNGEKNVEVAIISNAPDSPKAFPLSATGKDPALGLTVDVGALAPADFGRVAADSDVVRTFTITNGGEGSLKVGQIALDGDHQMEFGLSNDQASGAVLTHGQSKTVQVVFRCRLQGGEQEKRKRIEGTRKARLVIPSNAVDAPREVDLTAETYLPPILGVTPASVAFDPTEVTLTTSSQSITIANRGGQALQITRIERTGADRAMFDADRFSSGDVWTGSETLDPGKWVLLFVSFKPVGPAGAKSCTITVTSDAPNPVATVTLQGTAAPGVPRLEVTPANLAFPTTEVGGNCSESLTIQNAGTAPMTVTRIERTGADRAMFGADRFSGGDVWTGSETIDPGKWVLLFVNFKPVDPPGAKSCTITITSNALNPVATVALQGTATPGVPRLEATPANLAFPATEVRTRSSSNTVTIRNRGTAPMTVTRIERTGADRAMFSADRFSSGDAWTGNLSILPGDYEFLFITFEPGDPPGDKNCTITVTSNASNSPASVTLQGSATPAVPRLELSFDQNSISAVAAGSGVFKGLYINNRGGAPFTISRITKTGTDAGMFESSDLDEQGVWTGSTAVAPGRYHAIYINFRVPSGATAGSRTCTIEVTSDAPGSPHQIVLNGNVA